MIKLRIVVENIDDKDAVLSQLFALDLLDTIVVMEDPVLTDTDVERLPLGDTLHQMDRWYADGKFSCKFAHPLKPQNMFALYQKSALSLVK